MLSESLSLSLEELLFESEDSERPLGFTPGLSGLFLLLWIGDTWTGAGAGLCLELEDPGVSGRSPPGPILGLSGSLLTWYAEAGGLSGSALTW